MITFQERLSAAKIRLSALPEDFSIRQASVALASPTCSCHEWHRILSNAISAGELLPVVVDLPPQRYTTLGAMEVVEEANRRKRQEPRIARAHIESWLVKIGAPVPWRAKAEVESPDRARRALSKELERRHIRG